MGSSHNGKIGILIASFLLVALCINRMEFSENTSIKAPLEDALKRIRGWQATSVIPLDKQIVESLDLDDHINAAYSDGRRHVHLYVGYYKSAVKIGAAHDPLVCFPGQGWLVTSRKSEQITVESVSPHPLTYTTMVVERGTERQLIVYWFQSFNRTASDTFTQKLNSLWQRFKHRRGDNAFVRVSVAIEADTMTDGFQTALDFVHSFYPVFIDYIEGQA